MLVVCYRVEVVWKDIVVHRLAKPIDCVHHDVFHKMETLSIEELLKWAAHVKLTIPKVDMNIVQLRVQQSLICHFELEGDQGNCVFNNEVQRSLSWEEPESSFVI